MFKKIFLFLLLNILAYATVNLNKQKANILEVSQKEIKIDLGNLKKGQTGIIVRTLKEGHSVILKNASVKESSNTYSILKINNFEDLKQDALPTFNSKINLKDTFILNYLYSNALLITPNQESFIKARRKFESFNFLHSDIFASYMKIDSEEYPDIEEFQEFALNQNLGLIFFVIEKKVYIYDAKTFILLDKKELLYTNVKETMPFYTRVENIDNYEEEYSQYYKKFLGIKND